MTLKNSLNTFLNTEKVESLFGKKITYTNDAKKELWILLGYNYPFININRILPDTILINFNFLGLKNLNEKYGQSAVDEFLYLTKILLIDKFFSKSKRYRKVRNNYKNFTVNVDKKFFLSNKSFLSPSKLLEFILTHLCNEYKGRLYRKIIKYDIDFDSFLKDIKRYLGVGIGYSKIGENLCFCDKLQKFYEAEISSKLSYLSNKQEGYDIDLLKETLSKAYALESQMINKYGSISIDFLFENKLKKQFSLVNNDHLNFDLIFALKKFTTYNVLKTFPNLSNLEIDNLIKELNIFYQLLNASLDYIPPYISFKNHYFVAQKIQTLLAWNKAIDIKYLLLTYKSVYPKKIFEKIINNKKGILLYLDIGGLGKKNIGKLYSVGKDFLAGKKVNLLNPLEDITNKFINLKDSLQKAFPGSYIALGGDEILLFTHDTDIENFVQKVDQLLNQSEFCYRYVCYVGHMENNIISVLDSKVSQLKKEQYMKNLDCISCIVSG